MVSFKNVKKLLFLLIFLLPACAIKHQTLGPEIAAPHLTEDAFVAADGKQLALSRWTPEGEPWAVMIALHGFNGYRGPFEDPGKYFAENGIHVYAYDQRGFGEDELAGRWADKQALASDVVAMEALVRVENPGLPVFVLGESMGGAVALYGLAKTDSPDGLILVAPAVWGWSAMNPLYRLALWASAHIAPGYTATGEGLGRVPSDNYEMLNELFEDPLVIKETRVDAVYGLVGMMEAGLQSAIEVSVPVLLLYGEQDELVPARSVERLKRNLPNDVWVERRYNAGYHMLLFDCQRANVWRDIIHFMADIVRKPTLELSEPEAVCQD